MFWAGFLAAVAGYIDAICYLRLGGAFAANMTGNLVRIGMEAAHGRWSSALWVGSILIAFIIGVVVSRLIEKVEWPPWLALLVEALLIAAAATGRLGAAAIPVLAASMAMQNEAVTHGIVNVNVGFVTGDLQTLGEQLATKDATAARYYRRPAFMILTVLICYAVGAAIGTFAVKLGPPALGIPAGLLAVASLLPEHWTRLPFRRH